MSRKVFVSLVIVFVVIISGIWSGAIQFNSPSRSIMTLKQYGIVVVLSEVNSTHIEYTSYDDELSSLELKHLAYLSKRFGNVKLN